MIKAAIEKILELGKLEYEELKDGRKVYTKALVRPPAPILPETLTVNTLGGLITYYEQVAAFDLNAPLVVHIVSPTEVHLFSHLSKDEFAQRRFMLQALHSAKELHDPILTDLESFLVILRSRFADAGDRQLVLDFLSKVDMSDDAVFDDDGVSQTATIKKGVAGRDLSKVPSPVTLVPCRTFPEVDQPCAKYVLRLKKTSSVPSVTLTWVDDGGRWKLLAIKNIQLLLEKALPEDAVILA